MHAARYQVPRVTVKHGQLVHQVRGEEAHAVLGLRVITHTHAHTVSKHASRPCPGGQASMVARTLPSQAPSSLLCTANVSMALNAKPVASSRKSRRARTMLMASLQSGFLQRAVRVAPAANPQVIASTASTVASPENRTDVAMEKLANTGWSFCGRACRCRYAGLVYAYNFGAVGSVFFKNDRYKTRVVSSPMADDLDDLLAATEALLTKSSGAKSAGAATFAASRCVAFVAWTPRPPVHAGLPPRLQWLVHPSPALAADPAVRGGAGRDAAHVDGAKAANFAAHDAAVPAGHRHGCRWRQPGRR